MLYVCLSVFGVWLLMLCILFGKVLILFFGIFGGFMIGCEGLMV